MGRRVPKGRLNYTTGNARRKPLCVFAARRETPFENSSAGDVAPDMTWRVIQPSLRDLFNRDFEPTLERVG